MAKIKTIEYFRVLPRWLFVKVVDEDGNHGWGESTLEGHTEAVEGTLNALCKRFQGYEADDIEHIWQMAWRLGFYRGGPVFMSAISGIDIALWDLKGRKLGVPIHQLIGGKVRNKLSVYAWIGGDRPDDVEAAGKARLAQGFKAIKMNATEDVNWLDSPRALESSVERLKAVKALGLDAALDFHGRLHKPMAKQLAKALEPHKPLFLEEPLLSEHPEGIKQLSDQVSCPIALGERLYSRWDVKRFLEDASVDVLQPDISHCGGISELRRIASMAETYDVAIAPHCPLGPIALAACMQVDLAIPNFVIQEMSLGIHYNTEAGDYDITSYVKDASVFDVKDGYVDALTAPGLGIEVDEETVRRVAQSTEPGSLRSSLAPMVVYGSGNMLCDFSQFTFWACYIVLLVA
ncbi:D-galactonate dehydratase [Aspergillus arachidicola]|uniref:D-galactonate dehydratase n=1 Tax=Aspergillus arachidicola TaxID=656916 RepID=A0A2G7G4T2_9EURO|nr:D-galactonate dehydratase [Aspergillus arachidicola]